MADSPLTPAEMIGLLPFAEATGVELLDATAERVDGRLAWAPERCTTGGVLHGGALMTLTDTLGAVCAFLNLPPGATTATLESKTNLLRPVRAGHATGAARCLHRGGTTIVVETTVTDDDGRPVAVTIQTQIVLPARATPGPSVVERYSAAWRDGDLASLVACYAPDFTLHYAGTSPLAGDHVGLEAALDALAEATRRTGRELLGIDETLTGNDAAVLVVRERFDRDGEQAEVRRVLRYRIEDDRFVECWLYDEDQALVDRFWSRP
ncbi:MAG: hotdog fold thioesterase [Acidimicrobiales bacterium]